MNNQSHDQTPVSPSAWVISADQRIERSPDQDLLLTKIATVECPASVAANHLLEIIGSLPCDAMLRIQVATLENITAFFPEYLPEDDLTNDGAASE